VVDVATIKYIHFASATRHWITFPLSDGSSLVKEKKEQEKKPLVQVLPSRKGKKLIYCVDPVFSRNPQPG
jgi:hypothetical protein